MVKTLKPGQLEEDYPITMFSENKRILKFLNNLTNNIHLI